MKKSELGSKKSLKERLKKKQEDIKKRGSGKSSMIFLKADQTIRARLLPLGPDEDFTYEVVQFYLGNDIKGVISPATFGEPCPILEKYEELKDSKNPEDKDIAKKLVPKRKFVALVNVYSDLKGKEFDPEKLEKLILLPNTLAQQLIDYYLDEDEWGDMTDPKTGYDVKFKRVGSGKMDTEYFCSTCSKTPLAKPFSTKQYNLEQEVRKIIPTYDDLKESLNKFLSLDEDGDTKPKKSLKKKKKKPLK